MKRLNKPLLKVYAKLYGKTILGYSIILLAYFGVSLIVGKFVESIAILLGYSFTRNIFPITFHCNSSAKCTKTTIIVFVMVLLVCIDSHISLLIALLYGFYISLVVFIIEWIIVAIRRLSKPKTYSFDELLSLGLTNRQADLYLAKKRGIKGERLIDYMLDKGYDFSKSTYDREIKIIKNIMKDC